MITSMRDSNTPGLQQLLTQTEKKLHAQKSLTQILI